LFSVCFALLSEKNIRKNRDLHSLSSPGLPDFSCQKHYQNGKNIYQMTTNFTQRLYIIPNGHKIFQKVIKYNNIFYSKALQHSKFYLNRNFGFENKPSGNPALDKPEKKF
jgi:hypothetical protein